MLIKIVKVLCLLLIEVIRHELKLNRRRQNTSVNITLPKSKIDQQDCEHIMRKNINQIKFIIIIIIIYVIRMYVNTYYKCTMDFRFY